MAFNGSGVYNLPTGNPVVTNTTISSTWANNTLNDIASALSNTVTNDGQSTPTGNLKMGGFKFTGMAAGSGTGESVRWEQLFSQGLEQTIASASTVDIGGANTCFLNVTGTTAITSFGTNYNGPRYLRFAGAVTLTNSSTLICPGGADIVTAAGDVATVIPKATSNTADGWAVVGFQKNATPGTPSAGSVTNASLADGSVYGTKLGSKIQPITASVASNALTLTLNPTTLDFRSSTLSSGAVSTVTSSSPVSLVVPASATLGTVSAQASRLVLIALNNAGTIELAVVNISGGNQLDETNLISTTAISSGSTASNVVYSTTARTGVAYRVVGFIDSTQTTAGTWATAPSTIQGSGGQALAAMSSIGYGQTEQAVARNSGATYYNTTGKPIFLTRTWNAGVGNNNMTISFNGRTAFQFGLGYSGSSGSGCSGSVLIPVGVSYTITDTASGGGINALTCTEIR